MAGILLAPPPPPRNPEVLPPPEARVRVVADVSSRKLATCAGVSWKWQGIACDTQELILEFVPRRAVAGWHYMSEFLTIGLPTGSSRAGDLRRRVAAVEDWSYGRGDRPAFLSV